MIGSKTKRRLNNAVEEITLLKEKVESLTAQRDKIRRTRNELKFKLTDSQEMVQDYHDILMPFWETELEKLELDAVPDERIISHIAHRRDSEFPTGSELLLTGRQAAGRLNSLIEELFPSKSSLDILDFGCGCGRVTRFLSGENRNLSGCDIDNEAIQWAQKNLVNIGKFFHSPDSPPFDDQVGEFDVIIALSVFTHLPEDMQNAWLEEHFKKLKPGGALLATVHGESFHRFVQPDELENFNKSGFAYLDLGKTPDLPDYYLTAFHTHEYVKEKWAAFGYDIKRIDAQSVPQSSVRQDMVIAIRPS